jgi:ABC-type uncharacterized transport system substrate-binding protein
VAGALARLGLVLALALAPGGARAHPHAFIDGGLDFVFDAEGRLSALRVTWIYDPFTSLFLLEDLGIEANETAEMSAAQRAELAAYQTTWDAGFAGDSTLSHDGTRMGLSGPVDAEAEIRDGQVVIRFTRAVETPFRPGADTIAMAYDPGYFTAYAITEAPRLEGAAEGCRVRVEPFEPAGMLVALQERLLSLPVDATPEDPDVGALFADRIHVACD